VLQINKGGPEWFLDSYEAYDHFLYDQIFEPKESRGHDTAARLCYR
jgi:hypothetical protein